MIRERSSRGCYNRRRMETLRAFRWKDGHMTNLGSLNDDICSLAFGSNSKGQVVGNSIPCDVDGARAAPSCGRTADPWWT